MVHHLIAVLISQSDIGPADVGSFTSKGCAGSDQQLLGYGKVSRVLVPPVLNGNEWTLAIAC